MHGRGAISNPQNRFVPVERVRDPEYLDEEEEKPGTRVWPDQSRSIISHNKSPDIPFDSSLNPYRGCEHGCSYCYARPTHEYLGYSAGIEFEQNIVVKLEAPQLLRAELAKKGWVPRPIHLSGVTDCYQPLEKRLRLTRGCLEVLLDFANPVHIITKNSLILRDLDLLRQLNKLRCISVAVSVTSLRPELSRVMEPRAAQPARRLMAIEQLSQAGIPVMAMVAPVIPGLTDHELPSILEAVAKAGARAANYLPLRLPLTVEPVFCEWLQEHFPDRAEKVLNKIRSLRGGKLNDGRFHHRFRGEGPEADLMANLYRMGARKYGLDQPMPRLSTDKFRRPRPAGPEQLDLFS